LLREVVPNLTHVAFFLNPENQFHTVSMREALAAAQALNIKLQPLQVKKSEDLDAAFASIVKEKPDGLLILADRIFLHNRQRMMDFATEHRLPSVNAYRELVDAGGLTSYGPSYEDMHRRAADYVNRILKGEQPGDLPVEQPTKFTLIVNLKAAKAVGLEVAPTLVTRADEVIEWLLAAQSGQVASSNMCLTTWAHRLWDIKHRANVLINAHQRPTANSCGILERSEKLETFSSAVLWVMTVERIGNRSVTLVPRMTSHVMEP
jgi:hypothetical protein